jgi:hypothetical protein
MRSAPPQAVGHARSRATCNEDQWNNSGQKNTPASHWGTVFVEDGVACTATNPTSRHSISGCAPCRGCSRQCDRQWIAAQHHHQYQPPNRPLAVSVGAKKLGNVADRRILSLDLQSLAAQGDALGFEVCKGLTFTLALCRKRTSRVLRAASMAVSAVVVRPRLAASSIVESIWPSRRSRSATVWAATSTRAARAASSISIADVA